MTTVIDQNNHKSIAKAVAVHLINYVRWTQLVPMLVAWVILLFFFVIIALSCFNEQAKPLIEHISSTWQANPWLHHFDGPWTTANSDSFSINEKGFNNIVITGWSVVSLFLFLLSFIFPSISKMGTERTLKRNLFYILITLLFLMLSFVGMYQFDRGTLKGEPWQWHLTFAMACSTVFIISAYSLTVDKILRRIRNTITCAE